MGAPAKATGAATSPRSFGAGVRWRQFALDYAYQSFEALALVTPPVRAAVVALGSARMG